MFALWRGGGDHGGCHRSFSLRLLGLVWSDGTRPLDLDKLLSPVCTLHRPRYLLSRRRLVISVVLCFSQTNTRMDHVGKVRAVNYVWRKSGRPKNGTHVGTVENLRATPMTSWHFHKKCCSLRIVGMHIDSVFTSKTALREGTTATRLPCPGAAPRAGCLAMGQVGPRGRVSLPLK